MKKLLFILIITGGLFGSIYYFVRDGSQTEQTNAALVGEEQDFDISPASAADNEQIEQRKDENKVDSYGEEATDPKDKVSPTLVYAEDNGGNITVGSYVSATSNGTCTLTLRRGSSSVVKTKLGEFNVNKYDCNFSVARSELGAGGTWSAQVSFETSAQSGQSNIMEFEVS